MGDFTSLGDFVNISAPKEVRIDGAASRVFKDVGLAVHHFADYMWDRYGEPFFPRGVHQREYLDKITALAYLAANTGNGRIVYAGSSSGIVPYTCASQTNRMVVGVDPSELSWEYTQSLLKKFPERWNLVFNKAKLEDIVDRLKDGDTLFSLEPNEEIWHHMMDVLKTKNVNLLFGGYWPEVFSNKESVQAPYEEVQERFFEQIDEGRHEAFAARDPYYNLANYVLIKQKDITSKGRKVLRGAGIAASYLVSFATSILIAWGISKLTLKFADEPIARAYVKGRYELRQLYWRYSPPKQAKLRKDLDELATTYHDHIVQLANDPNIRRVNFASFSGAVYYGILHDHSLALKSHRKRGLFPKPDYPGPRELVLNNFIAQTSDLLQILNNMEEIDDTHYDYLDRAKDNAERRRAMAEALRDHGPRSDEVKKMVRDNVEYIQSSFFKFREIQCRDGGWGMAALEERFYHNLYLTLLLLKDVPQEKLPHTMVIAGHVMEASVEQQWEEGRIDANYIPEHYLVFFRKDIEKKLREQKYTDTEIEKAFAPKPIIHGDPNCPEWEVMVMESYWKERGYSDAMTTELMKLQEEADKKYDPNRSEWNLQMKRMKNHDTNQQSGTNQMPKRQSNARQVIRKRGNRWAKH